jgi:Tfp pilus assembly protein FimT
MTLLEALLVMALAAVVLIAGADYSISWIARENMRSAIYDVQTFIQLARVEAVSRNHECRFVVDSSAQTLQVLDTNGTGTTSDDTELYRRALPSSVDLARPDSGAPVTLTAVDTNLFETTFTPDGTVSNGTGQIYLYGGERYGRISVFGAGGTRVERWNAGSWEIGS